MPPADTILSSQSDNLSMSNLVITPILNRQLLKIEIAPYTGYLSRQTDSSPLRWIIDVVAVIRNMFQRNTAGRTKIMVEPGSICAVISGITIIDMPDILIFAIAQRNIIR